MRSRNVPSLRLEGFDGAWELKAIGDLSGRAYGGGTPSSDEPGYWSGDIPWIQSSDVAVQGVAPVAPRKHITREAISRSAAMQIPADSVAVVTRVGVGKVSCMPFPYATSQDFVSLSDLSGNPEYIALTVKRRMEGLADQLQGSTIKGITKTELLNQAVYFPPTLEEQQAIGAIFTNLDAAINQHTKKHQALQQAKTALMQRMFPQEEGQTVPELRLEGFDGEWKLIKLDTFDIKTGPFGSTLHAKDYVSVGTPIVTTEHFKSGQLPNTGDDIPQVSKQDAARLSMYALNEGDIVFSRVGSVDINARVTQCQKGWLFSGRVLRLRLDASCDAAFLHSALETEQVRTSIISRAVGQTMPSINTKILGATEVAIPPTLEEQQAIGAVFTRLDTLIATEAKYIESLKQAKTALLQQMFI